MTKKGSVSIRVVHIYARSPERYEQQWQALIDAGTGINEGHRTSFEKALGKETLHQMVELQPNIANWPSITAYMLEVADDPSSGKIMSDAGWAMAETPAHHEAEIREDGRQTTLFVWSRPLVRLGTCVIVEGIPVSDADISMLLREFGQLIVARAETSTLLLIAGVADSIMDRCIAALNWNDEKSR